MERSSWESVEPCFLPDVVYQHWNLHWNARLNVILDIPIEKELNCGNQERHDERRRHRCADSYRRRRGSNWVSDRLETPDRYERSNMKRVWSVTPQVGRSFEIVNLLQCYSAMQRSENESGVDTRDVWAELRFALRRNRIHGATLTG